MMRDLRSRLWGLAQQWRQSLVGPSGNNVVAAKAGEQGDAGTWRESAAWKAVQNRLAGLDGEVGIAERARAYAPFFQGFGRDVRIGPGCYFSSPFRIVLEDGARINREAIIEGSSSVRIGRNCRIGPRLFLHSANHDLDDRQGTAYFERGYEYAPVVIEDNVLISGNVTILPGASIGAGSFVAAGAVVTGRRWSEGSRLMGVPAIDKASRIANGKAPGGILLAIVTDSDLKTDFQRLVAATRMAGIAVMAPDEALPASVRVLIIATRSGALIQPVRRDIPIWHLQRSSAVTGGTDLPFLPDALHRRRVISVRNGYSETPSFANCAAATLYAAWNYALKGSPPSGDRTWHWQAVRLAQELRGNQDVQDVIDELNGCGLLPAAEPDALTRIAAQMAGGDKPINLAFNAPDKTKPAACRADFLSRPDLLPPFIRLYRDTHPAFCHELLSMLHPHAGTAERLAAIGLAAAILGRNDLLMEVSRTLIAPEWVVEGGAAILARSGHPAVSRSPLVGACLLVAALEQDPNAEVAFLRRVQTPLIWPVPTPAGSKPASLRAWLVDAPHRLIAWEMFENWRLLCALPQLEAGHILIDEEAYADAPGLLENIWREALGDILLEAGCPSILVDPWPEGYDHAVSLRFDVDRPVPSARIRALIDIQKRHLHAPAGSWYFINGASHNQAVRHVLRHWNQEYAHHGVAAADSATDGTTLAGTGVAMHSSGRSEYWRGAATIAGAAKAGALYAESMASLHMLPQLHCDLATGHRLWLTPLHFPLEGSTSERDSGYFWQRREAILRQTRRGGHVIIGTHPDCQESVLDKALTELAPRGAWAVPVARAVQRLHALLAPGALGVDVSDGECSAITLMPASSVADVVLHVRRPGSPDPVRHVVQLQGGAPRVIPLS